MTAAATDSSALTAAPPVALVVFGASGDLSARKIFPALARLAERGSLDAGFTLIGVARTEWSDDDFRKAVLEATPDAGKKWARFVDRFRYVTGEYAHPDTFDQLKAHLAQADRVSSTAGNRLFYLATIPSMFGDVAEALGTHGLNVPGPGGEFARLVVEKPFGTDLETAAALNDRIHGAFDEKSVYRIDHYMGKETVQNVLAMRFSNSIFEPIWNRRYVSHVQITVAESLGVEHRGGFYETAGALRDIVQNHVMQVLALTLMEPPTTIHADDIRDEKVKLLKAIDIPSVRDAAKHVVRGQYGAGSIDGDPVVAYRDEPDVSPTSDTETYVALALHVENWRWAGVPIFVRTGKRLADRVTEVALAFRRAPLMLFDGVNKELPAPNYLVVRIQPDEGISIDFGVKNPGEAFKVRSVAMDFRYADAFAGVEAADGYERLLHDAMVGDPTLFIRADEVHEAWRIVTPYQKLWADGHHAPCIYPAGTWGPPEADELIARYDAAWRSLESTATFSGGRQRPTP